MDDVCPRCDRRELVVRLGLDLARRRCWACGYEMEPPPPEPPTAYDEMRRAGAPMLPGLEDL